jgi:hypothetical protein
MVIQLDVGFRESIIATDENLLLFGTKTLARKKAIFTSDILRSVERSHREALTYFFCILSGRVPFFPKHAPISANGARVGRNEYHAARSDG